MAKSIVIVRIDPAARSIARMKMACGRDATREVRRILRAASGAAIGWHKLIDVEEKRITSKVPDMLRAGQTIEVDAGPTPLIAAGLLDVDKAAQIWRLRGCETHAGIGILFGQGVGGGMVDVPVDVAWIERRIIWGVDDEGSVA
jgi:hypothetical protein